MCPTVKSLHDDSYAPSPYSTILPQHRLDPGEIPRPLQNEYPVWYFLTGELARSENLKNLLELVKSPDMRPATVAGLREVIRRNCNLLVLPPANEMRARPDVCDGWAYCVQNESQEHALRQFKTTIFDIVRCTITISETGTSPGTSPSHSEVRGLTFVYTPGQTWFDKMSETPIKSTESAVGSTRQGEPFDHVPPGIVPMKSVPSLGYSTEEAMAPPSRGALVAVNYLDMGICFADGDDHEEPEESGQIETSEPMKTSTPPVKPPKVEENGFTVAPLRDGNPPLRSGFRRPSKSQIKQAQAEEQARLDDGEVDKDEREDDDDEDMKHYENLQKRIDAQKAMYDQEDREARALQGEIDEATRRHRFNFGQLSRPSSTFIGIVTF